MALNRGVAVRVALIVLIGAEIGVLSGHVFDALRWELALGPLVAGVVLAAVAATRSLAKLPLVVAGFGLVGVIAGVAVTTLAAGGGMSDVLPGLRWGPRRLISTEWPSPNEPTVVATVSLIVVAATVVGFVIAISPRWRLLPLVPLTAAWVGLLALGAPVRPPTWHLVVLGALAVAFAAVAERAQTMAADSGANASGSSTLARPRWADVNLDRTMVVSGAAIVGVSVLVASAVSWVGRADPRSTDDAVVSSVVLDPIEATVAMRESNPPIDLLVVSDRSPLSRPTMPSRWRMAAFDSYDGQRWVPSIDMRPIGGRLGESTNPPAELTYTVDYLTDMIDTVPFPGRAISVDRDVETDADRVAVRLRARPGPGEQIVVHADPAPALGDAVAAPVVRRQADEIEAGFADQAALLAQDGTDLERVGRIAEVMRTTWQLDSSTPGAGQQLALLERFVTDTQRGTREQFVTSFVLLARSLGYDARVASGFAVEPADLAETFTIRTEQAAVWPEVQLEAGSWVAFDPVPPNEAVADTEPDTPPEAQSPAAAQPPIAPPEDNDDTDDEVTFDADDESSQWARARRWLIRGGVVTGAALAPFAVVIGAVLVVKWRRRRARLLANDPVARVRGAWANATDSLVDAGLAIAPAWTDDRIAEHAVRFAPGVPHEARRLAAMSAAVTFARRSQHDAARLADDAAHTAGLIDDAIGRSRTRWERVRWRLSLRSLRRGTRSPVVP